MHFHQVHGSIALKGFLKNAPEDMSETENEFDVGDGPALWRTAFAIITVVLIAEVLIYKLIPSLARLKVGKLQF